MRGPPRRPRTACSAASSSAACTTSTRLSSSSASTPIASSESVCVIDAISPCCISFLITSETWRPRCSATSRTVAPDGILTGRPLRDRGRRRDLARLGRRRTAAAAAPAALLLAAAAAPGGAKPASRSRRGGGAPTIAGGATGPPPEAAAARGLARAWCVRPSPAGLGRRAGFAPRGLAGRCGFAGGCSAAPSAGAGRRGERLGHRPRRPSRRRPSRRRPPPAARRAAPCWRPRVSFAIS